MTIASFGYRHGRPATIQDGDLEIDVRDHFDRNPYHDRVLRKLRGDDPAVIADILKTPHFERHYRALKAEIREFLERFPDRDVYLGCTGGHHRSVYLVNRLGTEMQIPVIHLHYHDK